MKKMIILIGVGAILISSCKEPTKKNKESIKTIANWQMPAVAKNNTGLLNIVFGNVDSLMYVKSTNNGITFSLPELIDTLHGLIAFATRGPQIAAKKKRGCFNCRE